MAILLETIRIEEGRLSNIEWHNRRFNRSRKALFGINEPLDLGRIIEIPDEHHRGISRCRVLYSETIEEIQFLKHSPWTIRSLKLVSMDEIDYSHKYADRELLMKLLERKGSCDEVLIIKDGCITDTSISNVVFLGQDGSWYTPDSPLLRGTMREKLLHEGRIREARILPENLPGYSEVRLINCMMDLDASPSIPMDRIMG